MINLPEHMLVLWENNQSLDQIIDQVFPNLGDHINDVRYMGESIDYSYKRWCGYVDWKDKQYISRWGKNVIFIWLYWRWHQKFELTGVFNSISTCGLSPHKLTLKRGVLVMLLRNIDPKLGLCNGIRLLCHGSYKIW